MRVDAHAKVNLSLRVLAREASGFHQIETLFCKLDLADEIDITLTGDDIVLDVAAPPHQQLPDLGPVERNLAVRAVAGFAARTNTTRGVHVHLLKRIPHGAGLGGGSSDAAAILTALNTLHGAPLTQPALLELAGELGSDVPFFMTNAALALAWGRGNRIAPLPPLPKRPVLLALPQERVPTADAYAALSHARGSTWSAPPALLDPGVASWADVARSAHNDFEQVVFQRLPVQRALREVLADSGAFIARLTGTGSVVFGVFEHHDARDAACAEIGRRFPDVTCTVTETAA